MGNYNIGEVWWTDFPFEDQNVTKHRPAIVMDDDTIAVLAMKVTSQDKDIPYNIKIEDWKEAGLKKLSWARIDAVIEMSGGNVGYFPLFEAKNQEKKVLIAKPVNF